MLYPQVQYLENARCYIVNNTCITCEFGIRDIDKYISSLGFDFYYMYNNNKLDENVYKLVRVNKVTDFDVDLMVE